MGSNVKVDANADIIKKCIDEVIKTNKISVLKSLQEKDVNRKYIYNEISLQHELGIALRDKLSENYIVQFERNITSFTEISNLSKEDKKDIFKKSEIDIVIVNIKNSKERYAIELKYHKKEDGRIPNTMYDCIKDMYFAKALVNKLNFCYSVCVTISEDKLFYSNDEKVTMRGKLQNYMYFEKDISKDDIERRINNMKDKSKNVVYLSKNPVTLSIEDFYKDGIIPVKWDWIDKDDIEKVAYYLV